MKKNLYAFALTTSILGFASCSSPATEQADDRVEELEDRAEERTDEMEDVAEDNDTTAVIE
ncbi:hypothetical protein [Pontibacter rugosus]|uniref:Secreted protein n=1 Tax=Pontibacter rugosus TaxID=1745966 RepID=A0ABW3SSH4_9BACT